jgi:FkbM family methyltransferase
MNKALINKICSKFGFEIHGLSYMQKLKMSGSAKQDVFALQKEMIGDKANIIFDLGANNGSIANKYKALFPAAAVYCFEPFPDVCERLREAVKSFSDVQVYEKAVAEKSGKHSFFVNKSVDTNSLLRPQKIGLSSDEQVKNKFEIEVDVISINEFCAEKNIDHIDILKMDIQGGELSALKGATDLLQQKKIGLIYAECYFMPQYEEQPLFQDIVTYLYSMGYQLQDIYDPYYGNLSLAWCDAVFLPMK